MALHRMIYGMMEKDLSLFLVDPENLARAAGAVIQIFHALPQDAMLCSLLWMAYGRCCASSVWGETA